MVRTSGQKMAAPLSWDRVTTVMLRNIPSRYSQQALLAELTSAGFELDYFYLPMDFRKHANAGYAFLNFVHEAQVGAFRQHYDGQRLQVRSPKLLQVVPACLQGYAANYEHFQHSAVLNHHAVQHGPLFFRGAGKDPQIPDRRLLEIRELPPIYSREMVSLELRHHGLTASVRHVQVPMDPETHLNCGYALVGFHDEQGCSRARCVLHGASFSLCPQAGPMTVSGQEQRSSECGLPGLWHR